MASFTLAETDSDSILSIDSESGYHNSVDTVKQEMILEDEGSPLNASIGSNDLIPSCTHCRDTEDGARLTISRAMSLSQIQRVLTASTKVKTRMDELR